MKKYLSFISIILGLFYNLIFFNYGVTLFLESVMPILAIGLIGLIFTILALTKYKKDNKKIFSIIGLILNILPIVYFASCFLLA